MFFANSRELRGVNFSQLCSSLGNFRIGDHLFIATPEIRWSGDDSVLRLLGICTGGCFFAEQKKLCWGSIRTKQKYIRKELKRQEGSAKQKLWGPWWSRFPLIRSEETDQRRALSKLRWSETHDLIKNTTSKEDDCPHSGEEQESCIKSTEVSAAAKNNVTNNSETSAVSEEYQLRKTWSLRCGDEQKLRKSRRFPLLVKNTRSEELRDLSCSEERESGFKARF